MHKILTKIQYHIGFELTHDAAHTVGAVDDSVIYTFRNITVLGTGYAAHIISHLFVTNGCMVFAIPYHTAAGSHDAAEIGSIRNTFLFGQTFQGQTAYGNRIVVHMGVYLRPVGAIANDTLILTCNTANVVITINAA